MSKAALKAAFREQFREAPTKDEGEPAVRSQWSPRQSLIFEDTLTKVHA